MKMKFGLLLPLSGPHAGVSQIESTAMLAEQVGFDSVWSYDLQLSGSTAYRQHVVCGAIEDVDPKRPPVFFEPLTTLSYLAAKTERIQLGTGVVILPLANPFTVAKQAANLDNLSDGRFILGVGIGSKSPYSRMGFGSLNVPFEERGKIHDEYLRAIKSLWSEDRTSFTGKYLKLSDVELFPKPKNPTIWVAARGGPGFGRVAEFGDGWFPANFSPEEISHGMRKISLERQKRNRESKFSVASMNYLCFSESREKAIEIARATLSPRVSSGSFGRARSVDDAFKNRCFVGSSKDIAGQIQKFRAAGVSHLVFTMLFRGVLDGLHTSMKTLAKEVFPSFR